MKIRMLNMNEMDKLRATAKAMKDQHGNTWDATIQNDEMTFEGAWTIRAEMKRAFIFFYLWPFEGDYNFGDHYELLKIRAEKEITVFDVFNTVFDDFCESGGARIASMDSIFRDLKSGETECYFKGSFEKRIKRMG